MTSIARDRRSTLPGQGGFTLIELMIGVLISSILMGFVFAVTARMSAAYRIQTRVAGIEQSLQVVRAAITSDLRQSGFMIADGFRTAAWGNPGQVVQPVQIVNDSDGTGPDRLRLYYADGSKSAAVSAIDPVDHQYADVGDADAFEVGDLAVLVNGEIDGDVPAGVVYSACVVAITAVDATPPARITFAAGDDGGVNTADNSHCDDVATETAAEGADSDTVIYDFVGRSYRIDPARKETSVLQASPSGELVDNDWIDLSVGVTTLQFASRYIEDGDLTDADGDGNAASDWYSSEAQEWPAPAGARPTAGVIAQVSVGIEGRTPLGTAGVASAASADFIDENNVDNNTVGDWPAVDLNAASDARPEAYRGSNVYRWSTTRVDLRNMAVGR